MARGFVPRIRDLARQMELDRKLDDKLVEDMEAAGLFSVIVPKRWGGAGLGPHELNEVVETVAQGDVSTAWVTGFYNFHNWFLCRFPLEVQEELYAGRSSVRCAAILSFPGDGGAVRRKAARQRTLGLCDRHAACVACAGAGGDRGSAVSG